MGMQRADLGFADALDDFDPAEFSTPKPKTPSQRLKPDSTSKAAAAAGFRSREAKPAASPSKQDAPQRRRRTGRNAQLNLKARPETIESYCAIADRMGWGLGETLEKAVELMEREYATSA